VTHFNLPSSKFIKPPKNEDHADFVDDHLTIEILAGCPTLRRGKLESSLTFLPGAALFIRSRLSSRQPSGPKKLIFGQLKPLNGALSEP
jgi:hypothetical protein